jgi:hypothetical protein
VARASDLCAGAFTTASGMRTSRGILKRLCKAVATAVRRRWRRIDGETSRGRQSELANLWGLRGGNKLLRRYYHH